jgi:hypothetical protein
LKEIVFQQVNLISDIQYIRRKSVAKAEHPDTNETKPGRQRHKRTRMIKGKRMSE